MKSTMCIDVTFLAGTNLDAAITDAKEKALFLDVAYINFKFNGVAFSIGRAADITDVLHQYHDINKNSKNKLIVSA